MNLSKNFHRSEFTASATADEHGVSNEPTEEHLVALTALANCTLQPIRDHWGRVVITSGYRSLQLNVLVGGSDTSQHSQGEAADFHVPGHSNFDVAQWIIENEIPFDQLILEHSLDEQGEVTAEWLHISYTRFGGNRFEVLSARVAPDGTEYRRGLHERF